MITSKQNELVKRITALQSKKKKRLSEQLFVVEGEKFVSDILVSQPNLVQYLIISETFSQKTNWEESRFIVVSDEIFRAISSTQSPQGVLATVSIPQYSIDEAKTYKKIILLDSVQDPDNVGTLIRSAVCADFDAILLRQCADPYAPKSVRASAGTIMKLPVFLVGKEEISDIKEFGFQMIGADLSGSEETDLMSIDKLILVIGNEGSGISDEILQLCDDRIRIPIFGDCESLNAAMAGTLLMYHAMGY